MQSLCHHQLALTPPGEAYAPPQCLKCWVCANVPERCDPAWAAGARVKRKADPSKPRVNLGGCKGCLKTSLDVMEAANATRLPVSLDLLPGIPDPLGDLPIGTGKAWADSPHIRDLHIAGLKAMLAIEDGINLSQAGSDGIVYCGGGRYWPMTAVAIRMARMFTDMPIQVWYGGESDPVEPELVEGIPGITFHDVTAVVPTPRRVGGWENKTTAIIHSGFRRVLYLDADAYLVGDPTPLLDAATACRIAYWGDMGGQALSIKWDWFGVSPGSVPPIQGGQLAIDVVAFRRELVVAHWLNMHSDYGYFHAYGDQDMYRIALTAVAQQ